jgi:small conductance mechanosensitive channel
MNLNPNQLSDYANTFVTVLVDYSPKIISAFVILFLFYAIRFIIDLSENYD